MRRVRLLLLLIASSQQISATLLDFLGQRNVTVTHFMIGTNILNNPDVFKQAYETLGHDIAVHTWSHLYMTTLDDLTLLAELGWTMQLIHNSTGGRVPKYWRPPYGDSDNRVRAIAKEVFGMDMILWNQECVFFLRLMVSSPSILCISLAAPPTGPLGAPGAQPSRELVLTSKDGSQVYIYLALDRHDPNQSSKGPKTPGLIILHHEIAQAQVQVFINAYPLMLQNGWNPISAARLGPTGSAYQNADAGGTRVVVDDIVVANSPQGFAASSGTTSAAAASVYLCF
jgi:chitin deacetylase